MNMKKIIDARGLDCPKPVLETKKALENKDLTQLEIIVDNQAAVDNVSRFLKKTGNSVTKVIESKGIFTIYASLGKQNDPAQETAAQPLPVSTAAKTVFIASDAIGHGSAELGKKLMKAFTFTLTELETPPKRLLFMNAGVYLCLNNSDSLPNLKTLARRGVDIHVCGTCLDYLGVSNQLAVGKVSNMYDIASHLLEDTAVIKI
jgi:selenium metabolism protein YedF